MKRSRAILALLVTLLMVTPLTYALMANASAVKGYTGPKDVYRGTGADRGRPDWLPPPGQGGREPEPEPDPSDDRWAVVIGISDYRGRANDLQYCDDDATDMYDYLIDVGYPAGNIKLLRDKSARASAIMDAIDWLNSWEGADSEVVFFYSGHGSTYDGYPDGDDEFRDEGIVSTDLYLILDGQLTQKFEDFESQKIAFIFDTCYAGGMDDLASAGRVIVAACGETQLSWESTLTQNGVFTYHFVGTPDAGLQTLNNVEGAFNHAAPLAQGFMLEQYGIVMNPQLYDQYLDDINWAF